MTREEQAKKMGEIIARTWADEELKARLLKDATVVLKEEGIDVPEGMEIRVLENSANVFHMVIPLKPAASEVSDEQLDAVAGGVPPITLKPAIMEGSVLTCI